MSMGIIDTKNMIKFYAEFDAINFKYSLNDSSPSYTELYSMIEKFESMYHFNELTKVEYGDIQTNLDLIYAREEDSDNTVILFDLIRNKVINQYINIEGVERLFSEKYVDFEWDMHLGMDYKKHKMNYYRDHFVHQIRVAYCIHQLLDESNFNLIDHVQTVLKDKSNSKISRYVSNYIEQQKWSVNKKECPSLQDLIHVRDHERDLSVLRTDKSAAEENCQDGIEDFYYRNIIYTACYLSGLFHDIGYPETSNTLNQKRITEYIPNLYNAETSGYNYGKLNTLLQNSLLFRVVSFEEIQKSLAQDKPDHGALSAIIFLLHFYENGAIHGLEPYKKCAVELAALSIYNHTNKYTYGRKKQENAYVRISFLLNPISYLLRLCDDLQEWGRIYFELSNSSNFIICSKCKTPIVRKKNSKGDVRYVCNCKNENGIFKPLFEYDRNFAYRRIYNVTVCEELEVKKDNHILIFHLKYNLDRLLHIAYLNTEYANYRIKDLNKIKRLLDYQSELPIMKLDYFVTANPVLIKTQILKEYSKDDVQDVIANLCVESDFISHLPPGVEKEACKVKWRGDFKVALDEWKSDLINIAGQVYSFDSCSNKVKTVVEESICLYMKLVFFMEMYKISNQKYAGYKNENVFFTTEAQSNIFDRKYSDNLNGLLEDCLQQFKAFYVDISKICTNPDKYYEQFSSSDYTYGCIRRFISSPNYVPVCSRHNDEIDAFTDLAFFKYIHNKTVSGK